MKLIFDTETSYFEASLVDIPLRVGPEGDLDPLTQTTLEERRHGAPTDV
jgi:hypothetical protein